MTSEAYAHGVERGRYLNNYYVMELILLIILVLLLVGALPTWPHSKSWGYYPSGGLGLVLLIILIIVLLRGV